MSKQCLEYGEKVTVTGRVTGQVADTTDDILKFNVEFGADSACVPYSLINQPDEPQKVVIPRFVADWLIKAKEWNWSLSKALYMPTGDDYTGVDCHPWMDSYTNQELFAKAWLDGYEVEQEKLYTVEIPNPHGKLPFALRKHADGRITIDIVLFDEKKWKNESRYYFTEAEIKKDFEWAWQFAEEVKE